MCLNVYKLQYWLKYMAGIYDTLDRSQKIVAVVWNDGISYRQCRPLRLEELSWILGPKTPSLSNSIAANLWMHCWQDVLVWTSRMGKWMLQWLNRNLHANDRNTKAYCFHNGYQLDSLPYVKSWCLAFEMLKMYWQRMEIGKSNQ